MTRIACVMMQQDEDLLLRPWLTYHGYLFGFENLHVFDAASGSAAVQAVLEEFAALGVHVDRTHGPDALERREAIFAELVGRFKAQAEYDVVLPLDCSQFVIVDGPAGIGCHRTHILAALEPADTPLRMTTCLVNRPGFLDLFDVRDFDRTVIVVRDFDATPAAPPDVDEPYRPGRLMCIELSGRPFSRVLEAESRRLERLAGAAEEHLKFLLMTPTQYYRDGRPDPAIFLRFRGLVRFLHATMRTDALAAQWEAGRPAGLLDDATAIDLDEVPFRAADYLQANPDVATNQPLRHFVEAGFWEWRVIDDGERGRNDLADRMIQIAAWQGDGVTGYANMANTFMVAGRTEQAEQLLTDAIARYGENDALLIELGLVALHNGEFARSGDRWDAFRIRAPDSPMGYAFGSLARRLSGNLDQAEELVISGLARFPDDFIMLDAEAQIAGARNNWARAVEVWRDLLARFPEHRELIEQKLIEAGFQRRFQALDSGRIEEIDIMDGPVAVAMNDDETRRALRETGFADTAELRTFFMGFESLGFSCEFGMVQRRFGAEPISLLRWNSIGTEYLAEGLEERFEGLDAPDNLVVLLAGAEYVLGDERYQTRMHTFTYQDGVEADDFLARQSKRTSYLKRKLLGDLADARKIFVHLSPFGPQAQEIERLLGAYRSYGAGRLLTVTSTDRPALVGCVEACADDHLAGYVSRLGGGAGGWNIDFDAWLSVCLAAAAHWQREKVLEEPVS